MFFDVDLISTLRITFKKLLAHNNIGITSQFLLNILLLLIQTYLILRKIFQKIGKKNLKNAISPIG